MTHCTYGEHGPTPCPRHAKEATMAADRAEAAYRADAGHLPARDVARDVSGVRAYAWKKAFERPSTPCDDGSDGLGWPTGEEGGAL